MEDREAVFTGPAGGEGRGWADFAWWSVGISIDPDLFPLQET